MALIFNICLVCVCERGFLLSGNLLDSAVRLDLLSCSLTVFYISVWEKRYLVLLFALSAMGCKEGDVPSVRPVWPSVQHFETEEDMLTATSSTPLNKSYCVCSPLMFLQQH